MGVHAVIDFETTGLSPALGARPTEVAIVFIAEGKIVDRFQSLMNPGVSIPNDIQALTGITNEMVRKAPKVEVVIRDAVQFVGTHPIVAHNAAFDSKFWDAELHRINGRRKQEFACSMLLARRIFPEAPNHKLGTLVRTLGLPAALEMGRLAQKLDARWAGDKGLVHHVTPAGEHVAAAERIARRLCEVSAATVRATRTTMYQAHALSYAENFAASMVLRNAVLDEGQDRASAEAFARRKRGEPPV